MGKWTMRWSSSSRIQIYNLCWMSACVCVCVCRCAADWQMVCIARRNRNDRGLFFIVQRLLNLKLYFMGFLPKKKKRQLKILHKLIYTRAGCISARASVCACVYVNGICVHQTVVWSISERVGRDLYAWNWIAFLAAAKTLFYLFIHIKRSSMDATSI